MLALRSLLARSASRTASSSSSTLRALSSSSSAARFSSSSLVGLNPGEAPAPRLPPLDINVFPLYDPSTWKDPAHLDASRRAPPLTQEPALSDREVPASIDYPPYADSGEPPQAPAEMIELNEEQIVRMRRVSALAAKLREFAGSLVEPGITTEEIDEAVHKQIILHGAYPSPLNYMGFPKSLCSSVNEVVCHGIPDHRPLQDGDIVNLDVSVYYDGVHGDCSATFMVGEVDEASKQLVEVTYESMQRAIDACEIGMPLSRIGDVIADTVEPFDYGIVREYCGHGINWHFHCMPLVFHFRNAHPGKLVPNMAFTIEPMINEGSRHIVKDMDEWTILTRDRKRSAQFEETLLMNPETNSAEILTTVDAYDKYW